MRKNESFILTIALQTAKEDREISLVSTRSNLSRTAFSIIRLEFFHFWVEMPEKTFFDVAGNDAPATAALKRILVVDDLIAQGVELFVQFRGNTGIEGHAHGNVVRRFVSKCLANGVDVQGIALLLFT